MEQINQDYRQQLLLYIKYLGTTNFTNVSEQISTVLHDASSYKIQYLFSG